MIHKSTFQSYTLQTRSLGRDNSVHTESIAFSLVYLSTFRGTSLDSFTKEVFSGIGMHISMIPEERRQQYTNRKSHTLTV